MNIRMSLAVLAVVLAAAVACSAAGPSDDAATEDELGATGAPDAAAASGVVSVYTSVPEPIADALSAEFEEAFDDLELSIFRGTAGDVQARITTEQQAGRVGADVIWIAEPSAYEGFKAQDLLAPYDPPEDAPIPDAYIDPDGFYVAGRVINMIVAWNTEAHPDGLEDWDDLLTDQVDAVFPAPGSGSALAAIKAMDDEIDPNYFDRFVDAGGTQVTANGDARDAIVSGEFTAAGVLDYMIREAMAEGSPVDYAWPTSGAVVIPSPLAITAGAANPEGAEVFADYILSAEGQETVVEVGDFYPVRDDVDPPEGTPALDDIEAIDLDWGELVEQTEAIDQAWSERFGG